MFTCYGRVYDRAHLASHPLQKVTSLHVLRSLGERWPVGYGTTTSVAENQGWHRCRQKGGVTCKTAAAICD